MNPTKDLSQKIPLDALPAYVTRQLSRLMSQLRKRGAIEINGNHSLAAIAVIAEGYGLLTSAPDSCDEGFLLLRPVRRHVSRAGGSDE